MKCQTKNAKIANSTVFTTPGFQNTALNSHMLYDMKFWQKFTVADLLYDDITDNIVFNIGHSERLILSLDVNTSCYTPAIFQENSNFIARNLENLQALFQN